MVIRRGTTEDAAALAAFAERSFRDAFAADNSAADMDAYCAEVFSVTAQRALLSDASVITILAVDDDERIKAYVQLRPRNADGLALTAPVEIWRFYVDRRHHGGGVAQRLMTAVEDAARAIGARSLWLGVWERNLKAQAFYRKCGFVDVGAHQFVLGVDVQTDRLMARDIS
jgi:diamine N-acetyltransferase